MREVEQQVRCLKIVDSTYWLGSASLEELSALVAELSGITDASVSTVKRDIALLQRQGLPISVDGNERWRIDAEIPGFALRLTKAEASIVWAWCVACRSSGRPVAPYASSAALSTAVGTLLSGLRRFHGGSEVMNAASDVSTPPETSPSGEPKRRLEASKLMGEARLVYRRLRIFDLIESQKALNTIQIAAVLDVSRRTVHDDLSALRCSGLKIKFCRRSHEFRTEGLSSYLADRLTLAMAGALLVLFKSPNAPDSSTHGVVPFRVTSEKLAKSIRLMFMRRSEDLQTTVAS
ncbi:MAG: HTH domain-containing protein [Phycisphaerales bacterium]|nr:MAG: HTH domain-containing protein [Phycisphaerales bacterium]